MPTDWKSEEEPNAVEEHPLGALKTHEEWKRIKGTSEWSYAGGKTLAGWPVAKLVSESDYDDAIEAFDTVTLK